MKYKYLLFLSAALFLMSACNREEKSLFNENTSTRVKHSIENAENALVGAPYGWEMLYFPNPQSAGYNMMLTFKNDGSVKVAAKNTATTAGKIAIDSLSTWQILSDYGPILTFNTYNKVFHAWADPQDDGDGFLGDYEFLILENATDKFRLKGKKHAGYSHLYRLDNATTEEEYFDHVDSMNSTLFANNNLLFYHAGELCLNLYEGESGIFYIGEEGQIYSQENPEYAPLATTRTGIQLHGGIRGGSDKVFTLSGVDLVSGSAAISANPYSKHFVEYLSLNGCYWVLSVEKLNPTARILADSIAYVFKKYDSKGKAKYPNADICDFVLHTGSELPQNQFLLDFRYTTDGKSKMTMQFIYSLVRNADRLEIQYINPVDSSRAATMFKANPKVQDLLKLLSGIYTIQTTVAGINPTLGVKITSTENTDSWYYLSGSATAVK